MKLTHHSTDDIVFRLEYAALSTPELALLREAAAYITNLRKQLEESQSSEIVLVTESGEEIAVIDGELADWTYKQAVTEFVHKVIKNAIAEHEPQQRPD
jgi:hypothetical protein